MSNKSHNRVGTIIGIVSTIGVLILAGLVITNRQYILDQFNVWAYTPTDSVASIANRSAMSEQGKFYFYTSQPAVETAEEFNASCIRQEASSAILGCYSDQRIYIYDVPNTELDGVEEVTAAHETLHAVWERMDGSEKKRLSILLASEFAKINNPELNERMAYYDRTEPGERDNELHSILGTEFANLGVELETHYAKYFADRSAVLSLYAGYQAVFDNLKSQSDALAEQLASLKVSIDANTKQYNIEAASVSNAAADLKDSSNSVDRTSAAQVNAFNLKREVLLERIDALESLRVTINSETDTYNTKITEYNKIVVSSNELNKSLDSSLSPAPSL